MKKEMNVLVSVNKGYLEELKEMIFSFAYNNRKKYNINVYLMYIELDEENLKNIGNFIKNKCKSNFIPVKFDSNPIEDMPVDDGEGGFFGLEAYSRLFSPYQLPQSIDRLLYLDADLICDGDMSELYEMDFEDNCFIACQDVGAGDEEKTRLGLPTDYKYINSGVLLINTKKIREVYSQKDIINLIVSQSKILKYPDQDFINKNFEGMIKIMHRKFNLVLKDIKKEEVDFDIKIYHYAGGVKPWHDNVNRFHIDFIKPYYKYLFLEKRYVKLMKLYKKHKQNRKNVV